MAHDPSDAHADPPDAPESSSPARVVSARDDELELEWIEEDDGPSEEPEGLLARREARPADPPAAAEAVLVDSDGAVADLFAEPGISDDAERAALLAAILREQALRSGGWRTAPRRRTPAGTRMAAAVLVLVAGWLWLLPPGWAQPDLPPPVPAELQEAGLRLGMYLQAQQIESFRRRRGRLPDVLEETGEPLPRMHYRRLDARVYRLHGVAPSVALTYVSTDTLSVFVSDAQHVVGFGSSR